MSNGGLVYQTKCIKQSACLLLVISNSRGYKNVTIGRWLILGVSFYFRKKSYYMPENTVIVGTGQSTLKTGLKGG